MPPLCSYNRPKLPRRQQLAVHRVLLQLRKEEDEDGAGLQVTARRLMRSWRMKTTMKMWKSLREMMMRRMMIFP